MRSSYLQNSYGEVFRAIVEAFKPQLCVELGVLDGYSTYHIASGLIKNRAGRLEAYDLFEDYPYKHSRFEDIQKAFSLDTCGLLSQYVQFFKEDAFKVSEKYAAGSVGLLHVDLSNTGNILKLIMDQWDSRMVHGGVILFEGGTNERDFVDWMVKYDKMPIKPEMESNPVIRQKYVFGTYLKFPGLSVLLKKR